MKKIAVILTAVLLPIACMAAWLDGVKQVVPVASQTQSDASTETNAIQQLQIDAAIDTNSTQTANIATISNQVFIVEERTSVWNQASVDGISATSRLEIVEARTSTWNQAAIDGTNNQANIIGSTGSINHASLINLSFDLSGHTGFVTTNQMEFSTNALGEFTNVVFHLNTGGVPFELSFDLNPTSPVVNEARLTFVADGKVGTNHTGNASIIGNVGIGLTHVTGTRLALPQENDAATPTLAFGDGDTGFYEAADDSLRVGVGGIGRFLWLVGDFRSLHR